MRYSKIILTTLLFAGILSYVGISFFAFPFADDFCFGWTAAEKISFAEKFLKQYLNWNGRYSTDVLVQFHPLITGSILVFQLCCAAAIVASVVTHYFLFRSLLNTKKFALVGSLSFSLFFLYKLPNLSEHFYWYIGIVNYLLPQLFIAWHIIFLQKFREGGMKNNALIVAAAMFMVIAIGFNEITALLIPLFYFVAVLVAHFKKLEAKKWLSALLVIAVIASAFVIFSPGNFGRAGNFSNNMRLFHSLFFASLQTARFGIMWSLNLPFIFITLIVAANAHLVEIKGFEKIDWRLLFGFMLVAVFSGSFLPYFATGILGQHHTMNFVLWFFMLLWPIVVVSFSRKYFIHHHFKSLEKGSASIVLLIISAAILTVTGNGMNILRDTIEGNFTAYKTSFINRQQTIIENPENAVMPLEKTTRTFEITDARIDTSFWANKCIRFYYTQTYIPLQKANAE
jgi:hypothetical protein